jgi:hypothetical protein
VISRDGSQMLDIDGTSGVPRPVDAFEEGSVDRGNGRLKRGWNGRGRRLRNEEERAGRARGQNEDHRRA